MLKTRVITGFLLAGSLIAIVFLLPFWGLFAVFLAIVALAALEWTKLCRLNHPYAAAAYVLSIVLACWFTWQYKIFFDTIIYLGVLIWLVLSVQLFRYKPDLPSNPWYAAHGFFILTIAFFSLASILNYGNSWMLLVFFLIVSISDIAAFFLGRKYGRTKLAVNISPGKTVAGLIGALLTILAASLAFGAFIWKHDYLNVLVWVAICMTVSIFSVLGDLYVSLVKRRAGVKDSGKLLPGHGGVLDRIDGILAAAPVYALAVKHFYLTS